MAFKVQNIYCLILYRKFARHGFLRTFTYIQMDTDTERDVYIRGLVTQVHIFYFGPYRPKV